MKKTPLLLFLLFVLCKAEAQNFDWAISNGSGSFDESSSVIYDNLGNVISTGSFQLTADFDPSVGTFNLTSNGGEDIFIQKLDAAGNFIWAVAVGGTNADRGSSVSTDSFGNIYVTGKYQGTVDFDPGTGVFNLSSVSVSDDAFVLKLDAAGNFIWAISVGDNSVDYGTAVHIGPYDNVFVTGYFSNTVDFDPGVGTANLSSNGGQDIFVQKLSSTGNFLWAKNMGGSNNDRGHSISTGPLGNIYITGIFQSTADFDPGVGVDNQTSNGSDDVFVEKLDTNGNMIWVKTMGGTNVDNGSDLIVDTQGDVYTIGYFWGTADYDPGVGVNNLVAAGSDDVFIQKLDSSGNFAWAHSFGGTQTDEGYAIDINLSGEIYTTGYFSGTVDFDPGAGVSNLSSTGGIDVFIQRLDANGTHIWSGSIGSISNDKGASVKADNSGNVYIAGYYTGFVDFDPGVGTFNITSSGGSTDIFVMKLQQCATTYGIDPLTACDSLTWSNGVTYYANNFTAKDTLVNAAGCDSIVTLDLAVNYSNSGTDTRVVCDSLVWIDSNTYYTNNTTATYTVTNYTGCDSLVTLNLTITGNSTTSTHVHVACDSLTWIDGNTYTTSNNTATHIVPNAVGCDSIITLDLTINNGYSIIDSLTACDSLTWIDGITYFASNNTATDTLTSVSGCDSIITLNLTIDTIPDVTIDPFIPDTLCASSAPYVMSASTPVGGIYSASAGFATPNMFDPFAAGVGTHTVYYYHPDTMGCYGVDSTQITVVICSGIDEINKNDYAKIYPNPTKSELTIELKVPSKNVSAEVLNTLGQVLINQNYSNTLRINLELEGKDGIYFVRLNIDGVIKVIKVLKN